MNYLSRYKDWLFSDYFDEETKEELEEIRDNQQEIEDRFYQDLEFGTGGLRGVIGAGTNRMNRYTVQKATQGLANYILNYSDDGYHRGVVIAYDSRHKSPEFALEAALVLTGNGIKTYLFSELHPTPMLSFAVRELNAIGGIVVTASHNPPEYNGYKVYWEDGGQVVPDQAREITAEIEEIDDFGLIKKMERDQAEKEGLLQLIGEEIDRRYRSALLEVIPEQKLAREKGDQISIIFTPLYGTGNKPIRRILEELGFTRLNIVEEQARPDPDFPEVKSPNPENFAVFEQALKLAEEVGPDLIIGTDPDCDRMGIVVKDSNGEYIGLTGNQIGVLLANYLLEVGRAEGNLPDTGVIIKTIVTTRMINEIAADYGIEVIDVLTGFKYIGEQIKLFEEDADRSFIFGFEESYGYLAGTYARDKDAVIAAALAAVMTLHYSREGLTLYQKLRQLMESYGYYREDLTSIRLEGKEGQEQIKKTLAALREDKPRELSGLRVVEYQDFLEGKRYNYLQGCEEGLELPRSNVLQYELEDSSLLTIRPSGTEPKLKIYFSVRGQTAAESRDNLELLKDKFLKEVKQILAEV